MSDNIHVAIRLRPLIQRECDSGSKIYWKAKDASIIYQKDDPSHTYRFDRVFDGSEPNNVVYNDLCASIVDSVMQGFNGTVFAYGQTSSGKTYTMMGDHGIIPNAIHDIFKAIDNMPDREFLLRVSYMEIYKENVSDLLSESQDKHLKIQEDADGMVLVVGLTEIEIKTFEEVFEVLSIGGRKRRIGETQMNEKSSRSHAIFRMIIESRMRDVDGDDAVVNVGQLNLVDLAGSERASQTATSGAAGDRFKECTSINKSLLTLALVINQLSEENTHISYRSSNLTRILQNSLGGNARTVIICTVTPACLAQTQSTIEFAKRAKQIKNKPIANVVSTDQALLKRYNKEIRKLTQKLEALQQQNNSGTKEILEKELEEKSKQNEDLKLQIEELKQKFVVSQLKSDHPPLSKKVRRETWCGGSRRNRIGRFPSQSEMGYFNTLPSVKEEPISTSSTPPNVFSDLELDIIPDGLPSLSTPNWNPSNMDIFFEKPSKSISIQTEENIVTNKELSLLLRRALLCLASESRHKTKLEKELQELQEFTKLEKVEMQPNELSAMEVLKDENMQLRIEITNYKILLKESNREMAQLKKQEEELTVQRSSSSSLNSISPSDTKYFPPLDNYSPINAQKYGIHPNPNNLLHAMHSTMLKDNTSQTVDLEDISTINKQSQTYIVTETCSDISNNITCTEHNQSTKENGMMQLETQTPEVNDVASNNIYQVLENDTLDANCTEISSQIEELKHKMSEASYECQVLLTDIEIATEMQQSKNELISNIKNLLTNTDFCNSQNNLDAKLIKSSTEALECVYENKINSLQHIINTYKIEEEAKQKELDDLKCIYKENVVELNSTVGCLNSIREELVDAQLEVSVLSAEKLEQCDVILSRAKENSSLKNALTEMVDIMKSRNDIIKELTAKLQLSMAENGQICSHYKQKINSSVSDYKILQVQCDKLRTENESFEAVINVKNDEIQCLKKQIEANFNQFKFTLENDILLVEKTLKANYDFEYASIEKRLNVKHELELKKCDEKCKLQIRELEQKHRCEKLHAEEELLKLDEQTSETIRKLKEWGEKLDIEEMQTSPHQSQIINLKNQVSLLNGSIQSYVSKEDLYTTEMLKLKQQLHASEQQVIQKQKSYQQEITDLNIKIQELLTDIDMKKKMAVVEAQNAIEIKNLLAVKDRLISEQDEKIRFYESQKYSYEKNIMQTKCELFSAREHAKNLEAEITEKDNIIESCKKSRTTPATLNTLLFGRQENTLNESYQNKDSCNLFENMFQNQKIRKLEEDNAILLEKLSVSKNEIRRLQEDRNESKIAVSLPKEKSNKNKANYDDDVPIPGSGVINSVTCMHLQSILYQRDKEIKKLKRTIEKYQAYVHSKQHATDSAKTKMEPPGKKAVYDADIENFPPSEATESPASTIIRTAVHKSAGEVTTESESLVKKPFQYQQVTLSPSKRCTPVTKVSMETKKHLLSHSSQKKNKPKQDECKQQ